MAGELSSITGELSSIEGGADWRRIGHIPLPESSLWVP
jgi:hypothetical protein